MLDGVRVLDATRLLPGGFCTMLLADMGAEVIKVEEPGLGDYMRLTPPLQRGRSPVHAMVNRNKMSIGLNLKSREGKAILRELLRKSDVFIEGFRPGAMSRLGFSFADVKRVNPRIIYCSISSYGSANPLSSMPGHDLNFQAMSGVLRDLKEPHVPLVQLGDLSSAMYAAVGILGALASRRKSAIFVDVPIVQSLISWLVIPVAAFTVTKTPPTHGHSLVFGSDARYNLFRTGDKKLVAVAAIENEFWHNLLVILGLPELEGARSETYREKEALRKSLAKKFATKTRDEWAGILMGKETCATPVLDIEEVLSSRWAKASGILERSIGKSSSVLSLPLHFVPELRARYERAPALGEHTSVIMKRLGRSPREIRELKSQGVLQ
ncbi:MAG: CoA transferase [Thaumarchaeota archaeon]|nr:CoA transferase [Nitrososphaerota archaeon]